MMHFIGFILLVILSIYVIRLIMRIEQRLGD